MIQITQFPKKCQIHKRSMVWEGGNANHAGWRCVECYPDVRATACPVHEIQYCCSGRKGVRRLYCRECVRKKISNLPERWHTMTKSGAAIRILAPL